MHQKGPPTPEGVKRCGSCDQEKPLSDFNRKASKPDGRQEVCRVCNRESSRRYYLRNREHHLAVIRARTAAQREASIAFIAGYLAEHPCVDCGLGDLRVLDFDHRPGSDKRDGVMQLVRNGFAIGILRAEIAKCDVRCRNCHAIATYARSEGNWRTRAMELTPPLPTRAAAGITSSGRWPPPLDPPPTDR